MAFFSIVGIVYAHNKQTTTIMGKMKRKELEEQKSDRINSELKSTKTLLEQANNELLKYKTMFPDLEQGMLLYSKNKRISNFVKLKKKAKQTLVILFSKTLNI